MNYYPGYNPSNYYLNYPYGNQYSSPNSGIQPYPPQPQPQIQPQSLQASLNGKIVDSEDVVKATEVPIGGYGIFPKADLSEIYIKSWNNNGTTSIITFVPQPKEEVQKEAVAPAPMINPNFINEVMEQIHRLEIKIDTVLSKELNAAKPVHVPTPTPSAQPKKEVHF